MGDMIELILIVLLYNSLLSFTYFAVTRVKSTGEVTIDINVLTRGMSAHGFSSGGPLDSMVAYDSESESANTI